MLKEDNKVINSLWIGNTLSEMELLTTASFTKFGHAFYLWTYGDIQNLPTNVILKDANEIIPENKVFKYDQHSNIDWGKGSYAGFSDIFRYKLLYEYGGWWVDMDVTCLQAFNSTEEYFFRNHWKLNVVGNIIKCPKGSELMRRCFEDASKSVNEKNENWHLPIEILNDNIQKLQLKKYIQKGLVNLDMIHSLQPYFYSNLPIPKDWIAIHWINSSNQKIYFENSTFDTLLKEHNITSNAKKNNIWNSFKKIIK